MDAAQAGAGSGGARARRGGAPSTRATTGSALAPDASTADLARLGLGGRS
jgi:hypothetical protein